MYGLKDYARSDLLQLSFYEALSGDLKPVVCLSANHSTAYKCKMVFSALTAVLSVHFKKVYSLFYLLLPFNMLSRIPAITKFRVLFA